MTKVIDVRDAVGLVRDGSTIVIGGSGAGHALPQRFIDELAAVFTAEGRPRDLTTVRVVGIGDFADRGFSQLGLPGLQRRTIGSNIGNEPRLGALVEANEVESYSFPQGVLSQLMREIAAGRPGVVTQVGLGTYVDPRQTGGKQNARTTEDLVEVVTLRGREWLLFHAFPIDVAVIRGTTADEDGNLTMEGEAVQGEMLAMAMAARNSGGIVIAQVRQLATRGSLRMRDVKVPAALIDHVYVDPDQWQTYITQDSPYYAGAQRRPVRPEPPLPLDVRKIIARRSLLEFPPGAICNLGFGISQLIGRVAWEEGITDQLVLTVEQGIFGGVPVAGNEGGAGFNYQAMIDQPYMFDFYDGGGLDIASLSFAEVDAEGNVNVHAFEGRVRGPGGFPNISARTPRINFVGTLTARGLEILIDDSGVRIAREGSLGKFVPEVREISFNGRLARERGQQVRYITERAVFALEDDGLVLTEVAPGIDVERDVLGQMGFRPRVADDVRRDGPATLRDWPDGPRGRLREPTRRGVTDVTGVTDTEGAPAARIDLQLGRVARLTIVNPPLNLVTRELLEAFGVALDTLEAAAPGDVRAVVVTGSGERAFSAGSHVGEFEAQRGPAGRARHELESGVARRLAELPMPTIAAIEGNALGGGLELALCCDLRIASERARLGLPEVRLAVTPGAGGTQRLPRVVGAARAKELILTGKVLTAEEAERIGLVHEVVPAGEAVARANAIGEEIAQRGPLAVREAKQPHRPRDRDRPRRRPGGRARRVRPHLRDRRHARGRRRVLRQA